MGKKYFTVFISILFLHAACFATDNPLNLRIVSSEGPPAVINPNTYFSQNFQVDRGASRTSGVAPLAIHFSAGFNPSSTTDRGFHNYDYSWNFGDSSSGYWGTTGKSKNTAKGPVAAHVYETPGTYTAWLAIRDASGVVDTETFTITVTDPDEVFSGTNTTCISTNSDFSGCPIGARQVTTSDISQIINYVSAGRRVLLHRGSSWTASSVSMPSNTGPVSIGAYGTGTSRDAKTGIYGNAPQISLTGGYFCDLSRKQDWRISDISFSGGSSVQGAVGGGIDMRRILMLRVKTVGFSVGIGWGHWNTSTGQLVDQMAVVECSAANSDSNNMYVGGERVMLLGNVAKDPSTSHCVRVWQAYQGVFSNNDFSGSSINSTSGRHALKFTGPGYSTYGGVNEYCTPTAGTGCLEHRTQFAVISDSIFGAAGPWPISIGPQDGYTDAYLSDIIFERNRYYSDYGTQSAVEVSIAVGINAGYSTIRNNIIDGTGSSPDFTGIRVWQRGVEPAPAYNEVYNNTIYRSDSGSRAQIGVVVESVATGTKVINNAISFPNNTNITSISNSSSDLVQSNNVLSNNCGFTAPTNTTPLLRDFTPVTGGSSILDEAGSTNVPVFDDLTGVAQRVMGDGHLDIGALEN